MKTRIIVVGEYTPNVDNYPEGADTTAYDRQSYEEGSIGLDELLELCDEGTVTVIFEKIASSESCSTCHDADKIYQEGQPGAPGSGG